MPNQLLQVIYEIHRYKAAYLIFFSFQQNNSLTLLVYIHGKREKNKQIAEKVKYNLKFLTDFPYPSVNRVWKAVLSPF